MNTPTIAGLYPFYLDCLRTHAAQPHRSLLDMMEIRLRIELALPSAPPRHYWVALRDQDNPQQRFDQLGMPTDEVLHEQVPARVFNWAQLQLLALPASTDVELLLGTSTGWRARAHAYTPGQGLPGQLVPPASEGSVRIERLASASEVAPLLRGLAAHQAKRRKLARRMLAQLRAYHATQMQLHLPSVAVGPAEAVKAAMCAPATAGLVPRLYGKLRRGLAAKIHQVAVAAQAALVAEGGQLV